MSDQSPRFWRTLEEREESLAARHAAENEFAPETVDDSLPSTTVSRRGFLGIVGATAALATAACTTNEKKIVPYTKRPVEVIPGIANFYASTFPEGANSYSVLVKTREGRPIHVSGNDEHPSLKGKTSARAIADVAALYDPDRVRAPRFEGRGSSWADAEKALNSALASAKRDAKSVLLVTGASDSPTRKALIANLKASLPTLEHLVYEPAISNSQGAASQAVFGSPLQLRPKLRDAEVIVSFGADFLNGDDPQAIADFTMQRRPSEPSGKMNRLWAFEGPLTLTGANADHRFPVKPSRLAALAFALAYDLNSRHAIALPPGVTLALPPGPVSRPQADGIEPEIWEKLLADVANARSRAAILCGDAIPADAQIAVHLLNSMLRSTVVEARPVEALATFEDIQNVLKGIDAGRYAVAILWDVNPAYCLPRPDAWKAAFAKIPLRVSLGLFDDESASLCQWLLPTHHWLESWGDFGSGEVLTLQQPAIAPIYDTRQGEDVILKCVKALGATTAGDYHEYLRRRWQREVQPIDSPLPFDRFFESVLHDGVCKREPLTVAQPLLQTATLADTYRRVAADSPGSGFELVLRPSTQVYDGRYANNGWLQELPDPITKNTWGNPLLFSVSDARVLGLENGDLVELEIEGARAKLPVFVQPGQAKGVLSLALGYGRLTGSVARGVGVNAYPFVGIDGASPHARRSVKIAKTPGRVRLPMTQSHHRMEGRDIVRSLTLAEFADQANKPRKRVDLTTLYDEQKFPVHKWGMAIDLSACVGCSACVVACQSENNIATVGAEQVERGREMQWIRIDSYYEGKEENPKVVHQPMLCQHCDSAPCENVCPVNATNHSDEGLNQMAYNRCVGTRYCANNCPYKVRRYNFFDYTSSKSDPEDLKYNPEVTVRPRGVMEKCTFCVQRIQDAKMRAKVEHREMRDGEPTPACAAACPSDAIIFGDLRKHDSRVSQMSNNRRGYKVLEEVGTRPAITYLANLSNPAVAGGSHE